jgi:hypothetical protein
MRGKENYFLNLKKKTQELALSFEESEVNRRREVCEWEG